MDGMAKDILTTAEAARILGVSVRTAQLLIEGGSIPSWKTPGGHRRVYRRDVLGLIAGSGEPPMLASARVILIARQERMADYKAALAKVDFCVVESYSDIYTALLAIGTRLPAAVVIEAETSDASRLAMLESLRADPSLGSTEILVVGRSAATRRSGGREPGSRTTVFVDELPALPAAIETVFKAAAGHPFPFETPPSFPFPDNEGQRLLALERSGLVDTPPEDSFDRLTWLAARSLDAPVALLTMLTPTRQWFKSRYGLDMVDTPRGWAFCNYTILQKGIMVAENLATDSRFAENPAVKGDLGFRFYAGCPVSDPDGFTLGSLCVIDTRPRALDETQKQILANLAALASDEIKLRATDRQLRWAIERGNSKPGAAAASPLPGTKRVVEHQ
ncbi:excisionase family DNA binding protein [Bradyrhizobium sp. R2.2-H]|jgi:excisionase family DNA binding protein|uniref:GAF domain-containing protein n=2 Tax=unclassified Bradyrhizobium TaxID=2631580 RepID=UPI0010EAE8CD|nr:excisionase family DNA binding protein [Bradyrhizobium sp. Y-H1]TCU64882.1 excisionase family DNA binding protein [Bradyrhizobium sp. R2.2-H]